MPYDKISDLPGRVRESLPRHAQEIYLKAFNNAWRQYVDPGKRMKGRDREETAHRIAWSAVERVYAKSKDGVWRRA